MLGKRNINADYTKNVSKGFSLIELLLVAATIPILMLITVTATSPAKRLAETRNIERLSNVQTIINGVYQYSIKNDGYFPTDINQENKEICNDSIDKQTCNQVGGVYLGDLSGLDNYIVSIPSDPATEKCELDKTIGTCYFINFNQEENRLIVSAPKAELDLEIKISY